jgi:hypothetical protein
VGGKVQEAASEARELRPLPPPPLLAPLQRHHRHRVVGDGGGGMRVAGCEWQPRRPGAPPPSPLLSGGGKVHGVDDEFMAVTSGSSEVVVGTCGLARGQCYDDATGGGDWA